MKTNSPTMATSGNVTVMAHHFLSLVLRPRDLLVRHALRRDQRIRALHFWHFGSVQCEAMLAIAISSLTRGTGRLPLCFRWGNGHRREADARLRPAVNRERWPGGLGLLAGFRL